ncbi:hypothetical protein [Terasakiella pusilla]|uniref:hypothetical protein n=1 Tax=Terasakiella pusilla TaxID=64973 RepID=UPI003AA85666
MGRDYKTEMAEENDCERNVANSVYHAASLIEGGEEPEEAIEITRRLNNDIYNLNNSENILNETVDITDAKDLSSNDKKKLDKIAADYNLWESFNDNLYS